LKAEQAQARADQKAKLQARIDKLQEKVHAKLLEGRQRSEQQRKEAEAKIQALEKKATKAAGEKKAKLEARIASIRKEIAKSEAHTEWLQTFELPEEEEMVSEMEALYQALPYEEYGKDRDKLTANIERLEKAYDRREKVIERIVEYGTGIESEKALRMYPTPTLIKWETSLETFRASKLKPS
jgi:chromosome segregation ATPase